MNYLGTNGNVIPFLTEQEAYTGVARITDKVIRDFALVTGKDGMHVHSLAEVKAAWQQGRQTESRRPEDNERPGVILAATLGHSSLTEELIRSGRLDGAFADQIRGQEERYLRIFLPARSSECKAKKLTGRAKDAPGEKLPGNAERLTDTDVYLILGSDKRGTIYGLFSLSEAIGVSPMVYWGDAPVPHREQIALDELKIEVSKTPSVRYRGFFINDEWPAFGNWCMDHFGGFNADLYDCVFEFLLRMKGNYIWPAMWTSSFPLDGPGPADMELADEYGVIWSFSHHEPCLRASEEWEKVRGEGTRYGNAWDYRSNPEGLCNYWKDALEARGRYENMITIGMRGEYDSALLGEDSPAADNIALLKEIITAQRQLIQDGKENGSIRPETREMLAVYKEVEGYYYGDSKTPGLYQWDGLDGVICMLSDDNFGHMRSLPSEAMRSHKGGYGMYYHLDYHGGPVSYEWVDSTPFSQIWEQMCEAYEHGVTELWIVNVGDLKFHEVTLRYFMDMAYDYETWGSSNPGSYLDYPRHFIQQTFPEKVLRGGMQAVHCAAEADAGKTKDAARNCAAEFVQMQGNSAQLKETMAQLQETMAQVLQEYIQLASLRRPESLHAGVFHPCHELETDRLLERLDRLDAWHAEVTEALQGEENAAAHHAYYSMIGWPCMAVSNLMRMHLYAGKNHHYAAQGRPFANVYADRTEECLRRDRELSAEWASFLNGKWKGMELAHHIGFTKWNDFGRQNPVVMRLQPSDAPILCVSRADNEKICTRNYGEPEELTAEDFRYAGNEEVILELSNNGTGDLTYRLEWHGDGKADSESEQNERIEAKQAEENARKFPAWLHVTPAEGTLQNGELQRVRLQVLRESLETDGESLSNEPSHDAHTSAEVSGILQIIGSDETVVNVRVTARPKSSALPGKGSEGTIILQPEDFAVEAAEKMKENVPGSRNIAVKDEKNCGGKENKICERNTNGNSGWQLLPYYGKHGSGLKWMKGQDGEERVTSCSLAIAEAGDYMLELHVAPLNPMAFEQPLTLGASVNPQGSGHGPHMEEGGQEQVVTLAAADRTIGSCSNEAWCQAVLEQERRQTAFFHLQKGIYEMCLNAREEGVIVEKIVIRKTKG